MKKGLFLSFILLPIFSSAQIEPGKYQLCFEMYWRCHTAILLDLNEDQTYKFHLIDDTSNRASFGTWELTDSLVLLYPEEENSEDPKKLILNVLGACHIQIANGFMFINEWIDDETLKPQYFRKRE